MLAKAALKLSLFVPPFRLRRIAYRRGTAFTLLDVGCGNHSPSVTKRWFPQCTYVGLDRERYVNTDSDILCVDEFFRIDLQRDLELLDNVPAADVIVIAHVIEHLPNGLDVIRRLCRKLQANGDIYVEFPSVRSLRLPHGSNSLHFCDDSSHVRVYDVREVANVLLESGISILSGGTRRDWPHIALLPLSIPLEIMHRIRHGCFVGPRLWDVLGFAEFVHGRRKMQSECAWSLESSPAARSKCERAIG